MSGARALHSAHEAVKIPLFCLSKFVPAGVHAAMQDDATQEESLLMSKARPKFLNLLQIRQPVPAVVSILHRISGALLFLLLWLFLAGLQRSLASPESYSQLQSLIDQPFVKLVILGLVWAYLHHTFAGIRHLGLDLRLGIQLPGARITAYTVLVLALIGTAIAGALLW